MTDTDRIYLAEVDPAFRQNDGSDDPLFWPFYYESCYDFLIHFPQFLSGIHHTSTCEYTEGIKEVSSRLSEPSRKRTEVLDHLSFPRTEGCPVREQTKCRASCVHPSSLGPFATRRRAARQFQRGSTSSGERLSAREGDGLFFSPLGRLQVSPCMRTHLSPLKLKVSPLWIHTQELLTYPQDYLSPWSYLGSWTFFFLKIFLVQNW